MRLLYALLMWSVIVVATAIASQPPVSIPEDLTAQTPTHLRGVVETMPVNEQRRVVAVWNRVKDDADARRQLFNTFQKWKDKRDVSWVAGGFTGVLGALSGGGLVQTAQGFAFRNNLLYRSYAAVSRVLGPTGTFVAAIAGGAVLAGGAGFLADRYGMKPFTMKWDLNAELGRIERLPLAPRSETVTAPGAERSPEAPDPNYNDVNAK
jgi:hypothetical protein